MKDKEQIETTTVDAFIALHNQIHGTAYAVYEYSDHNGDRPDAVCVTDDGEHLNVEVTITEDRPGDIPWALGRISQRPYQSRPESCLQGNVLAQLAARLDKKPLMRYGDAFVTLENRLAQLVKNEVRCQAERITSLSDLISWVKTDCRS